MNMLKIPMPNAGARGRNAARQHDIRITHHAGPADADAKHGRNSAPSLLQNGRAIIANPGSDAAGVQRFDTKAARQRTMAKAGKETQ